MVRATYFRKEVYVRSFWVMFSFKLHFSSSGPMASLWLSLPSSRVHHLVSILQKGQLLHLDKLSARISSAVWILVHSCFFFTELNFDDFSLGISMSLKRCFYRVLPFCLRISNCQGQKWKIILIYYYLLQLSLIHQTDWCSLRSLESTLPPNKMHS